MKPKSKKESYWRTFGKECRKYWKQGTGAFKISRIFTRKQSNKAMRTEDKKVIDQGMIDYDLMKDRIKSNDYLEVGFEDIELLPTPKRRIQK